MLDRNPDLKKEVEETEKLLNSKLKIKTINEFDDIVNEITNLGFKTLQEAKKIAEKLNEAKDKEKDKEEVISYLNAKKFCHYANLLDGFFLYNLGSCNDNYMSLNNQDNDYDQVTGLVKNNEISESSKKNILDNIRFKKYTKLFDDVLDYGAFNLAFVKRIQDVLDSDIRAFLINSFAILIRLQCQSCLLYIERMMVLYTFFPDFNLLLTLLSTPDRYNFFLQFHQMLENNLPDADKQLFYDYLDSCREKLQNEKYKYLLFGTREKQLTGVVIFGIIASAVVLTISLLEIYVATWFFWFGIVGIVLTVAVGIRLFLCIKANCNYLQELENDLQKEGKTIQDKIAEIDRAIDVYDLNKIRDFKEPELKKISTIETDRNKIINNDEINSTEQNDAPESEQDNSEENIENISNP